MKKSGPKIFLLIIFNFLAFLIFINLSNNFIKPALASGEICDNAYMPFKLGDQIEYKTSGLGENSGYTMKVIETKPGFAKIEYDMGKVVVTQNVFCKNGIVTTDTYMDFSSAKGGNVQMKSSTESVNGDLMPKDVKVGSVWTIKYDMTNQMTGQKMPGNLGGYKMTITTNNKAVSEERVSVPAGSFKALKVESISTINFSFPEFRSSVPMPNTSSSVTFYEWWVKDIGLVKTASSAAGKNWETVAVKISGQSNIVEQVTEKAVAPAVATVAAVNTVIATQSVVSVDFFHYLIFFITQPLLIFKRKKIKAWGTVYNSLSGLPEDLAVVRLQEAKSNKLMATQVTDSFGRFAFLVPAGQYKIIVIKKNFIFPTNFLKGLKIDEKYTDLYHGQEVEAGKEGPVLTPNIPIDPQVKDMSDAKINKKFLWQKYQNIIALVSPALGFVSFLIKPSVIVTLLFLLSIVMYLFFRRFAVKRAPKKWGKVMADKEAINLPQAVMRIFALPFNKLLDYRVTDSQGRYNFLVGNRKFFLTVTKDGYQQEQTKPFDFSHGQAANIIAEDIKLKKI